MDRAPSGFGQLRVLNQGRRGPADCGKRRAGEKRLTLTNQEIPTLSDGRISRRRRRSATPEAVATVLNDAAELRIQQGKADRQAHREQEPGDAGDLVQREALRRLCCTG